MPINSRQKGARTERYFAKMINELFPGAGAKRGQQHSGIEGDDVKHDIEGVHFESKGVEALNVFSAMEQAERDAKERVPVVLWKRNRREPLAVVRLQDLPTLAFLLMNHLKGGAIVESTSPQGAVPEVLG